MTMERKYMCEDCKFFTYDEGLYTDRCNKTAVLMTNPYRDTCPHFRISDSAKRYYEKRERRKIAITK